jgi:hypothetical protein
MWVRELERPKKQKTGRRSGPRNRYYAGAKLSEHKFLRILQGYAEGTPIQALEPTTHVSGKTIRATYRMLRVTLSEAVQTEPERFAGTGGYLFNHGALSQGGQDVLTCLQCSKRFRRYRHQHAPRSQDGGGESLLLLEKTTRIFCALDLRNATADAALLDELSEAYASLRPSDPLQRLADFIANARPHAHPELRLYEDYRRYLLKLPLGRQ